MANTIDLIKVKRGSSGNVAAASLERGEPAVSLDTKELWIGDGTGKIKITDVQFYSNYASFPVTGQANKLYIAKDTAAAYLWDTALLQYKKYELSGSSTTVHCLVRSTTVTTFPSTWQDLVFAIKDSETEPAKLYHDGTNQDRIVIQEEGYYRVSYDLVYNIPIVGGGTESDIDCTVQTRIRKNDANVILASLDENTYKVYYGHRGITNELTNDFVAYFSSGDWISLQIISTGDPAYSQHADLEVYKVDSIKGDKGDPGTPGSIWHNGSGVPSVLLGIDNDYYHNNDTGDVYNKQSGAWVLVSNIIGAIGPQGPPGEAFSIDEYDDLDEAKITSIETGSGASPSDLYYFLVLNDNRSNQTLPASLNGDMTGHVIMYDGVSWYDFGPFTGIQGPEGPPGASGALTEYHYAESETVQQTTNDQYDQKVRLTTVALTGGNYRINWYFEWQYSTTQRAFRSRTQLDDTTILGELYVEPQDSKTTIFFTNGGFKRIALSAGVHFVDLDWCSERLGDTATIRRARLELFKVI